LAQYDLYPSGEELDLALQTLPVAAEQLSRALGWGSGSACCAVDPGRGNTVI